MKSFSAFLLKLVLANLFVQALANEPLVCQQDWQFPVYPDNTTTVLVGHKYNLQWDSNLITWFRSWCKPCGDGTNVDLWVQTGHNEDSAYKIASGVNVKTTFSYSWTVNIGFRNATEDSAWVLRFVKFDGTPNNISGDSISSPLFKVKVPGLTKPSRTTTSRTPTATSSSSPTSAQHDSGLTTAARAGIGAGVGVAAIIALASCYYFCVKNRKRRQNQGWSAQAVVVEKYDSRDESQGYRAHPGTGQFSGWSAALDGKSGKGSGYAEMSSEVYRAELPVNEPASELSIERRISSPGCGGC